MEWVSAADKLLLLLFLILLSLHRKYNNTQLSGQLHLQHWTLVLVRCQWKPPGAVQRLSLLLSGQLLPK